MLDQAQWQSCLNSCSSSMTNGYFLLPRNEKINLKHLMHMEMQEKLFEKWGQWAGIRCSSSYSFYFVLHNILQGLDFVDAVYKIWKAKWWDTVLAVLDNACIQWIYMLLNLVDFQHESASHLLKFFWKHGSHLDEIKKRLKKEFPSMVKWSSRVVFFYMRSIHYCLIQILGHTKKHLSCMSVDKIFPVYKNLWIWTAKVMKWM